MRFSSTISEGHRFWPVLSFHVEGFLPRFLPADFAWRQPPQWTGLYGGSISSWASGLASVRSPAQKHLVFFDWVYDVSMRESSGLVPTHRRRGQPRRQGCQPGTGPRRRVPWRPSAQPHRSRTSSGRRGCPNRRTPPSRRAQTPTCQPPPPLPSTPRQHTTPPTSSHTIAQGSPMTPPRGGRGGRSLSMRHLRHQKLFFSGNPPNPLSISYFGSTV